MLREKNPQRSVTILVPLAVFLVPLALFLFFIFVPLAMRGRTQQLKQLQYVKMHITFTSDV